MAFPKKIIKEYFDLEPTKDALGVLAQHKWGPSLFRPITYLSVVGVGEGIYAHDTSKIIVFTAVGAAFHGLENYVQTLRENYLQQPIEHSQVLDPEEV